jgi:hypothetical protein
LNRAKNKYLLSIFVRRLKGTDPENGELTFSISGEYFRVNRKTGDITLIRALDREVEPKIDVIISLTGNDWIFYHRSFILL